MNCGIVWSVVCCGAVPCCGFGAVWCGVVWCGAVRCGAVRCGAVRVSMHVCISVIMHLNTRACHV